MLPMALTLNVTSRCNSRCKTCNLWSKKVPELALENIEEIFRTLGRSLFWLTLSGGEPFLRKEIVQICQVACRYSRPSIINIPTNGILCDVVPERVRELCEACPDANFIINHSIDEIGEKHDEIRNAKDNYEKMMRTYQAVRALEYPNLEVGIHTVISRFNVKNFQNVYDQLIALGPDSYITEIAENRVELDTLDSEISPAYEDYVTAIDFLKAKLKEKKFRGVSKITQAFRLNYYDLVKRILREERQVLPCYSGFSSAQIFSDGQLWTCCVRGGYMGNLADAGFDFPKVWFGPEAREMRASVKRGECHCPLANAAYTNMLCDFRSLVKAGLRVIGLLN